MSSSGRNSFAWLAGVEDEDLEDEFVLPAQFTPDRPLYPSENLLIAIIEGAWRDLTGPTGQIRLDAVRYFMSESTEWMYSFVAICQHFEWSPGEVRAALGILKVLQGGNGKAHAVSHVKQLTVRPQRTAARKRVG